MISGLRVQDQVGQSIFNSPGQSPGRAIVLSRASALAAAAALANVKILR